MNGPTVPSVALLGLDWLSGFGLESTVEAATGWGGLVIVFVYSFLIAFALPSPSEIVLAAPLDLELPRWAVLTLIVLVSATGKALGSVVAFRVGQGVKRAGPISRRLRESRFDVVGWSERGTVAVARRYGYAGLAVLLSIPFFPDTLPIYAFAVIGDDYAKFALATFVGSAGRLLVTLGAVGGILAFV